MHYFNFSIKISKSFEKIQINDEIQKIKEQSKARVEEENKQFDIINTDLLNLRSSFSNISADVQAAQYKLKKMNPVQKKTTYIEGGPSSEEFFELEKKVNENQHELEDLKQSLSNLQDKTKILSEYDEKLDSMNQRLDEANLPELKDKVDNLNAENTVIKSKIKEGILNEPSIDFKLDEVNKLKKQMNDLLDTLKKMKYDSTIKNITQNIDDINSFVEAFKQKIISIEDKLQPSESRK